MDCMRVLCMWPCLLAVYVINTGMHTARSECAVPNIRGSLSDEWELLFSGWGRWRDAEAVAGMNVRIEWKVGRALMCNVFIVYVPYVRLLWVVM